MIVRNGIDRTPKRVEFQKDVTTVDEDLISM
jgi:hypothetical protein